jgi:phosphatidylglycerol:prolipoprotein diacylglycerol transferase
MVNFVYPNFNPVALDLGLLKIHWYGVAYAMGILLAWRYCVWQIHKKPLHISSKALGDYIPWAVVGIILGGRLGIALFYNFDYYSQHPLEIFYIWKPGMAFHGGLLGVILATLWYCHRNKLPLLELGDLIATGAPIGLFFGRCANFINGELWGRPTDVPWGMIFPHVDNLPRHPSQLYEAFLEGILLFVILYFLTTRTDYRAKRPGFLSGIFLIGYGCARILVEYFREPNSHIGYFIGGTTLGQWLSFPLIIGGFACLIFSRHHYAKRISERDTL